MSILWSVINCSDTNCGEHNEHAIAVIQAAIYSSQMLLPVRQSKPHINVYQGGKIMSVSTKVRLVCGINYVGNMWKQNGSPPNGSTAYIRRPGHSMKMP